MILFLASSCCLEKAPEYGEGRDTSEEDGDGLAWHSEAMLQIKWQISEKAPGRRWMQGLNQLLCYDENIG